MAELVINAQDIGLRDFTHDDIDPICDYWFRSPVGFTDSMAVDLALIGPEPEFRARLQERLDKYVAPEQQSSCMLVITYQGEAIGCHNLNYIHYGDYGIFHAHIWNPSFRRRGLGSITYPTACRIYMQRFALKKIMFHTPKINPGPNRLKEKLGIRRIGEVMIENPIVKIGTMGHIYELTERELAAMGY